MHTTLRRVAALAVGSALALTGLVHSPAQADATPSGTAATTWLTGELTGGLMHNPNFGGFDDYGLSVDTGFAELGTGNTAVATQIRDAVATHINDYITGEGFGDPGSTYAGPTAKALAYAQASGGTPTSFGGVNLVTRLESVVGAGGRIADVSTFGDNANTIGQSFAARALTTAGSARTADVTAFLLKQQCPAGFFRLDLGDTQCAANTDPDTDVTAFVILNLQNQVKNPAVAAALQRAVSWLVAAQGADGSFGGGDPTTAAPNTNSTGLAAAALGQSCVLDRAYRAAAYVRGFQVPVGQTGPLAPEVGAIAYDSAARAAGRAGGITDATSDQWRRATAQAAPGLAWDPAAQPTVSLTAPRYARAGGKVRLKVTGAAAGERVCLTGTEATQVLTGTGTAMFTRVAVSRAATKLKVSATTGPGADKVRVKVLHKLRLRPHVVKVIHRGDRQVIRIPGLAKKEQVRVLLGGKRIAKGLASRKGVFVARFKVGLKPGSYRITVLGQFANRKGFASFRVLR